MDDLLFFLAAFFPPLLAATGVGFVWHVARMRTPADVEQDVLAAVSERDALPIALICKRPPLAGRPLDPRVVHFTLEQLRREGRLVRWYSHEHEDQAVYRRIA
jgi:hypothetical protein